MKVEFISNEGLTDDEVRIGGEVIKSNFLNTGDKGIINLYSDFSLTVGDVIKLTCWTTEKDKDNLLNQRVASHSFEDHGSRFERWNKDALPSGAWEKIIEIPEK